MFDAAGSKQPAAAKLKNAPAHLNTAAKRTAFGFCMSCEMRSECLQAALENDEWGYWAGTTKAQRDRLKRRKATVQGSKAA